MLILRLGYFSSVPGFPLRSRSRGCLRKDHGLSRFQELQSSLRLEENLGGAAIKLTAEDMHSLEEASSVIKVEGERYPATHAKLIDR